MKSCTPMFSYGTYINLWTCEGDYDVFIIINEINTQPTFEEVIAIEEEARIIIHNYFYNEEKMKEVLLETIQNMDLECVREGVQIVINKLEGTR